MKAYFKILLLAAIQLTSLELSAAELRVRSGLSPELTALPAPSIKLTSEDVDFKDSTISTKTYEPKEPNQLLGEGQVAFDTIPTGYTAEPITIRLPMQRKKPLAVVLMGIKINDTPQRVREIYGTNIQNMELNTDELYKLYQEASYLSIRRLNDIQKQGGRRLYDFDVKIFFKYLEITRELGRNNFLKVGKNPQRVQAYLREQNGLEQGREVIAKALGQKGPESVRQLIDEIDFVDADHLNAVWKYLKESEASLNYRQCRMIMSFISIVDGFDERMVERWNADDDYKFLSLGYEALTPCTEIIAAEVRVKSEVALGELQLIDKMADDVIKKSYFDDAIKGAVINIKGITTHALPSQ